MSTKNPIEHKLLSLKKRELLGLPLDMDSKNGGREAINSLVRSRDNHTCQKCGKIWKDGMRRFDVHHTDEDYDGKSRTKGILKYNKENLDKLITLCHHCHMNLDITRRRMSEKSSPINFINNKLFA